MPRIEMEDEVKASPERVWALLSDASRFPEWVELTDRIVEAPKGAMAVGSTWREYRGVPPFKSEMQWRMTEFDAPRRQVSVGALHRALGTASHEQWPHDLVYYRRHRPA